MTDHIRSKILSSLTHFMKDVATDNVIGVAVSGGSDSVALLLALQELLPVSKLRVITVDHGLRSAAVDEALWVGRLCKSLGIFHSTVPVKNLAPGSNLQARAREARYNALADWGLCCDLLCLGHSQTDVAETFLIRLARGSGVDGLAAMRAHWRIGDVDFARPLLGFSRDDLRGYLRAKEQTWCEDPSNEDLTYKRAQMRQAQQMLDGLGLDTERLAKTAARMTSVQEALAFSLKTLRPKVMYLDFGDIVFDRTALDALPGEYVERMVSDALGWIGGQVYKPRNVALLRAISTEKIFSLHGCVLIPQIGNLLRISREYAMVAHKSSTCPGLWDNRYFAPNHNKSNKIQVLGLNGLALCPDWRASRRPFMALKSSPSLWQNDKLISAPMAGFGEKDVLQVVSAPWE